MGFGPGIPICLACRHLAQGSLPAASGEFRCTAFPDGIPDEIWNGGFDHRREFEGDRGVRFELEQGEEETLAAYERVNSSGQ